MTMDVLIIDDNPDALRLARARLKRESVKVISAESGREGLEMARDKQPDLVLLDIDMPDISGFDLCRTMKEDPELTNIPIIFLTGMEEPDKKVLGLDLGAIDYVTKPFDAFELRARVRAALRTKRYQDLLAERAQIDALTGLANRGQMTSRLEQDWAGLQRRGGRLAFTMADIDHFKRVNDEYGHAAGDDLLRRVAEAIRAESRQSDLVARYGGEEFAIVSPGEAAEDARRLAERCRKNVASIEMGVNGDTIRPTASFGLADADSAGSIRELIEHADAALYAAKEGGRDQVRLWEPGLEPTERSQAGDGRDR